MMRFGGLALIGTAVAIQTKEGIQTKQHGPTKEDFQGVTQELLHWFIGIVHDSHNTNDNLNSMSHMIAKLEKKRDKERLFFGGPEGVKAGATKIDNRGKKLEGEENVLVEKTEELHEREKDLRQQFMKFHADSDELFHGKAGWEKWHERLEQWFHDHHEQHIRDILANRLNEMLNFIFAQFPMQHARMNEACNLAEQYVHNFENGATNWEPVLENQDIVETLHKDCHMKIKEFEVGPGDLRYCVLREHGEWVNTDGGDGWHWESSDMQISGERHCKNLEEHHNEWIRRRDEHQK